MEQAASAAVGLWLTLITSSRLCCVASQLSESQNLFSSTVNLDKGKKGLELGLLFSLGLNCVFKVLRKRMKSVGTENV